MIGDQPICLAMVDKYSGYDLARDPEGNPYTVVGYFGTYQEMNNPLAMMQVNPTRNWSHKFVPKQTGWKDQKRK